MLNNRRRCDRCGSALPVDARFCEQCGAPIGAAPPVAPAEVIIGHLPGERPGRQRGLLGWRQTNALTLVITSSRLLFLRETDEMRDIWEAETEALLVEEERSGLTWRELMDAYDWRGRTWAFLYDTAPDTLLAEHPDNDALPLAGVISAAVALSDEVDELVLQLAGGGVRTVLLKNQTGRPAAIFLAQALGPQRVHVIFQQG